MIDVTFENANQVLQYLQKLPDALNAALVAQSQALADALVQNIRDDKLSGGVLDEKTGTLKNSIESAVEGSDSGASATVFVDGDVPYAAILEYGGVTKAHIIEAVKGKALHFAYLGKQAFFAHVNHPGSVIPEHSYLRSALADMQAAIVAGFTDALAESIA